MNALWSTFAFLCNTKNEASILKHKLFVFYFCSKLKPFLIPDPGDIHGSSPASRSGCFPSVWLSGLTHDTTFGHSTQAIWSGCCRPSCGPASCPLSASRLSDLLHQQSVSNARLLWNHRPAGGLYFLSSYFCLTLYLLKFHWSVSSLIWWRKRPWVWFVNKSFPFDQSEHAMSCCCGEKL